MTSRRRFLKHTSLSLAGAALYGCTSRGNAGTNHKVIVLGFDGMDPAIMQRLAREGKLPHLARLMEGGNSRALATTVPPLSPVAWATFTTGLNPGGHGIYDFVHRDAATMTAYLSTTRAEGPTRTIQLGDWVIPLSAGKISLLREGRAFWEILQERGIPTTVMRAPANFPPVPDAGRQLSGMGTPDIQGTYGVYSFFTTDATFKASGESGGEVFHLKMTDGRVQGRLLGPSNTFRSGAPPTEAGFTVVVDRTNPVAKVALQDQDLLLRVGEWSPWLRVRFDMVPYVQHVDGIVRFCLKATHPHLKLYATPVNIDPANPALPISTPESYAHELAHELGPFYTQGMPHDTKALSNGVLDDEEFLSQAALVLEEHSRLFDFELDRFREGFLFLYTDRVDQVGHMFWAAMDPDHPVATQRAHAGVIEQTYRDMDGLVGKALKRVDASTTLLVMSDHGFAPFYRAFNLNTWLQQGGYLKTSALASTGTPLEGIDWDATRAYGVGLQGLYVNARGRERFGIVPSGSGHDRLVDEIAARLLEVRDPRSGRKVVERVYKARETFRGAALGQAPDIVVGYARGYRVAWDSVLGKPAAEVFADNTDKWSGDHSMAAELVPGVLLANRALGASSPGLADLGPSVLELFGLTSGHGMEGRSVFPGGRRA
jgi:predicted AlkP superfamily phosphohydrolase/phosphomutase